MVRQVTTTTDSYWSEANRSHWSSVQIILTFQSNALNKSAKSDICILQSTCSGFVMMSNSLNSHEFGLSKVLGGYKLPCITYVLFSPNLLLPAPRAKPRRGSRYQESSEDVASQTHTNKRAHSTKRALHTHFCRVCGGWQKLSRARTHTHTSSQLNIKLFCSRYLLHVFYDLTVTEPD